ncbi:MAG: hypothetical protein ACTHLO_08555 [Pseudolabrys sp.]
MKKIIIALAALTLTSAAMAHPMHGKRTNAMRGADAQAMASTGNTVYAFGQNLGSDPDPQVRLQLLRSAGILDR